MLLNDALSELGLEPRAVMLALVLSKQRMDVRAAELSNCPRCSDKPERYVAASATLTRLLSLMEET